MTRVPRGSGLEERLGPQTRPLLDWAGPARRDLPWRRTRDPWAVLVSEFMLQQTQVGRVMAPYATFLDRFPTPAACAAAPAADVIRLWAGLGYNRRALLLHRAAGAVMADHRGRLPDRLPELLRLPGVGPYTARAVLAFAFKRDVAVLDSNAQRVLSRALGRAVQQADADRLVPSGQGWAWNQAVLDLGATVCRYPATVRELPADDGRCLRLGGGGAAGTRPMASRCGPAGLRGLRPPGSRTAGPGAPQRPCGLGERAGGHGLAARSRAGAARRTCPGGRGYGRRPW